MISILIKATKLPNFVSIGLLMKSVGRDNCQTREFGHNPFSRMAMRMGYQAPPRVYQSVI